MLPLQGIMEAVMRGSAEMQGQAQAKKVAADQAEANQTTKLSFTGKTSTGGVPIVKFEGPADLLNGTQQADLEQTYMRPKENAERVLSGAQRNEQRLRSFGFAPKTTDLGPEDVNTFGERRRARRELGGSVIGSTVMAALTQGRTDQRLVENLKNERAATNAATAQKFVLPLEDQDLQEVDTQLEAGRLAKGIREESRLGTGQYLQLRNQLLDQKNVIQYGDEDSFMKAASEGMNVVGGMQPDDENLFRRAFKTGRVSFLSDRIRALSGEEGKIAIQSYGNTPDDIERFVDEQAGASNLSDFERQRFRRTAKGLLDWKAAQEQKAADAQRNQERADERIALAIASNNRAAGDKPRKLTAFDTTNASIDALMSAKGDPSFEQTSVDQALNNRAGAIQKRLSVISEELSANDLAFAEINKQRARPGMEDDESLTRALTAKKEKGRQLVLESRRLQGDLQKIGGGATAEFITQTEYDALIASGETPESIAADGLRVRK